VRGRGGRKSRAAAAFRRAEALEGSKSLCIGRAAALLVQPSSKAAVPLIIGPGGRGGGLDSVRASLIGLDDLTAWPALVTSLSPDQALRRSSVKGKSGLVWTAAPSSCRGGRAGKSARAGGTRPRNCSPGTSRGSSRPGWATVGAPPGCGGSRYRRHQTPARNGVAMVGLKAFGAARRGNATRRRPAVCAGRVQGEARAAR